MQGRVLVVDDEKGMRLALTGLLSKEGYQVESADSGEAAVRIIEPGRFHVAITDLSMTGITGMQVLEHARRVDPDLAVIMITAYGSEKIAVQAMKLGAVDYLPKPFDNDEVRMVVRRVMETVELRRDHRRLLEQVQSDYAFEQLVGRSAVMRRVFDTVEKVADTDITVLVRGASGTGKELVANALHYRGPRRAKPLVKMNCAALSRELVESELFGHEKGAFTGAVARREGKFEAADGGTLFLDEVGDMPLETQAKFLRALQEREFERVGGSETIKVDVRVVSATHRDLEKQIADGTFREDLYYRLNVFPIVLPPLRDRTSDIGVLAEHFVQKYAPGAGKPVKGLDAGAIAALSGYSWPGNVRELENVIERALILTRGSEITAADLEFTRRPNAVAPAAAPPARATDGARPLGERLQEQERTAIVGAIDAAQGNIAHAARALGINRSTLYYRMRKHGLEHLLPMKDTPTSSSSEGA